MAGVFVAYRLTYLANSCGNTIPWKKSSLPLQRIVVKSLYRHPPTRRSLSALTFMEALPVIRLQQLLAQHLLSPPTILLKLSGPQQLCLCSLSPLHVRRTDSPCVATCIAYYRIHRSSRAHPYCAASC